MTRDGDYLPMTRLALADGGFAREDRWPTADDLGSLVILPGGEVGTLVEWWNAPTARSGAGGWSSTTVAEHRLVAEWPAACTAQRPVTN